MSLFRHLEKFGSNEAVVSDSGERLSYLDLAHKADASLDAVRDGCKLVAIDCDNSVDALCAWVGAARSAVPAILLDPAMDHQDRAQLFTRYGVAAHWTATQRQWQHLPAGPRASPHPSLALLLSTSGSTGSPKLVRLSSDNVAANAASIVEYLGLSPGERPIMALPMHYSYGLSIVHSHLLAGGTLILTAQSVLARRFWEFFREEEATSFSGVPAMYEMLRRLRFEQMDLPSLRTLTQAGGRLPPDQVRQMAQLSRARGWRFIVMYGQTEASPRMSWLSFEKAMEKPDSIGQAIPGGRLRLMDLDNVPVTEPHVVGELVYEGRNVMMGYAENLDDLKSGDINQGTLRTGDLAYFDQEGDFYLRGRLGRFLKLSGKRVSLDDVESFVGTNGLCCAATGIDDRLLVAVLQPAPSLDKVTRDICQRFRLHHSLVRVVGVPDFPRSGSGKLRYPALLSQLLAMQDEHAD